MTCVPFCYYAYDQTFVPGLGPIKPAGVFAPFALQIAVSAVNFISTYIVQSITCN